MTLKKPTLLLLAVLLLSAGPSSQAQDTMSQDGFQLIVHANNPIETLPRKTVVKIFLKQKKSWDGGTACQPVDQPEKSAVRDAFSRVIHEKSPRFVERFWQRQIFSGEDSPPPRRSSDEEVITFVASDIGAIGYVTADAELGDGVKTIEVTPK